MAARSARQGEALWWCGRGEGDAGFWIGRAARRDDNGRLRRRSWLVSKAGRFLKLQAERFAAYRNGHRRRHDDDPADKTTGVVLGLTERDLTVAELFAWRQDWRRRSAHPASSSGLEPVRARAA